MRRIVRFLLIVAAVIAALVLAAVIALFTLINDKSIESKLVRLAQDSFGTDVTLSRHVSVSRFPALIVDVPAMTFIDRETKKEKARIDSATLRIALWSLPLGAVNIVKAEVNNLTASMTLASPTTEALATALNQTLTFPSNVRVRNIAFNNATLDVTAGNAAARRHWTFSNVNLKLGSLSPEMTTDFDVSGAFTGDTASPDTALAVPAASIEPPVKTPSDAAAPEAPASENAAAPAAVPKSKAEVPSVSLLNLFVTKARAAETVPTLPPSTSDVPSLAEAITVFSQGAAGSFSATGTMTLSASDKSVSFEKLKFSADITKDSRCFSVVASAETLAVTSDAVTGANVNASVSEPATASGDVHLGAVDFRLTGHRLQSPEMRLAYSETEGSKVTSYEASASVNADLASRHTQLENLAARITVTGDASLPQDFTAQASGFMKLDFAANKAQAGISGTFAGAPFSFSGTVSDLKAPKAAGELMISAVDLQFVPRFKSLAWMKAVDFAGELRIGRITAGAFTASQMHSRMTVTDGIVALKDVVVNTADGRILGEASMQNDASWKIDGRLDGVNVERFFSHFAKTPVLSGVASGAFTAEGTGLDPAALRAQGALRLLRGAYKGLNARAVRDYVAGRGKAETITQAGAWTEIDEASGDLTLSGDTLEVRNIVSRSVFQRTNAAFTASLAAGDILGKAETTFAPAGGIPSVRIAADIAGKAASPVWTFDFEDARKSLLRAQGRPMVKEHRHSGDTRSELWQSVKDFFRF